MIKTILGLLFCGACSLFAESSAYYHKGALVTLTKMHETNMTITHIRVMAFDDKSKIPEHLIKLPIYSTQTKETE